MINDFEFGRSNRPRPRKPRQRRGAAVILVLCLLAITLATSYALVHTQFRAYQIHHNQRRGDDAKKASLAGLSVALRKMHESDWIGVDHTHQGRLSEDQWFAVTYSTGDDRLDPNDADYAMYPYRVTLTSVGYAFDPLHPNSPESQTTTAVVELIPRRLSSPPAAWSAMQSHTVWQWMAERGHRFLMSARSRIAGDVHIQSELKICPYAPSDSNARQQWLSDLRGLKEQEGADHRPFDGNIDLVLSHTEASTRELLSSNLGLALNSVAADAAQWTHPGAVSRYRLYPGGREYEVPRLGSVLENVALAGHPVTNPLGVFAANQSVRMMDNVQVDGVLIIADSDLFLSGQNIRITGSELRPIQGAVEKVRLPAAIVADDLRLYDPAQAQLQGLFAVWDEFECKSSAQNRSQLDFSGRLLCRELMMRTRLDWWRFSSWWQNQLALFLAQRADGESLFCRWLGSNSNLPSQPILTIQPESDPVAYHWQDWSQPIYLPHQDDIGLRWDIIRWGENP